MTGESDANHVHRLAVRHTIRQRRIATALLWTSLTITAISAALWTATLRWNAVWMTQFGDIVGVHTDYAEYL